MTEEVTSQTSSRQKTGKREFSLTTFSICLAWSIYSGDNTFLQTTFIPTLFLCAAAFGLHEYATNLVRR